MFHRSEALVQGIWAEMSAQLARCVACVDQHHAYQECYSAALAAAVHELDCARLAAQLVAVQAIGGGGDDDGGGTAGQEQQQADAPVEIVACLYEALTYSSLLQGERDTNRQAAGCMGEPPSCLTCPHQLPLKRRRCRCRGG